MACDQEMGGRTITLDFGSAGMSVKSAPRVMVWLVSRSMAITSMV